MSYDIITAYGKTYKFDTKYDIESLFSRLNRHARNIRLCKLECEDQNKNKVQVLLTSIDYIKQNKVIDINLNECVKLHVDNEILYFKGKISRINLIKRYNGLAFIKCINKNKQEIYVKSTKITENPKNNNILIIDEEAFKDVL